MLTFLFARLSSSSLPCRRTTQLGFLHQHASLISYSFSSVSKLSQSNQPKKDRDGYFSFTVSYLMNSLGMSTEVATKLSKRFKLKDPDQPDSVLNLLRSYGFSDPQISKIVGCYPQVLLANLEHNLLPRLRFVQSIGFAASEIPELFSFNPSLLILSLEKRIIPHYEVLKSVLDDDGKGRKCLKGSIWRIRSYDVKNVVPNIKVLRDEGVPQSSVYSLLYRRANVAFMNRSSFFEYVKFVKETGIEPSKAAFVEALIVVTQLSKSTWELKLDIFERCGWSRDVTLLAFSKYPNLMGMSEKKITSIMKFLIDEMGLRLEDIAGCPKILSYSMKQRIVPRWSVVKILKRKGLIKESVSLNTVIIISEKKFLDSFVFKFREKVPRLLEIYRGELGYFPEVRA
ncbi:hypothetical protein QN277_018657 [Acacia crassicarpa]|uniref:Uncharacterized protein n=1 Tax=Acacia crassicarpa TaxID=499986 RepID=A0AAE1JR14_9FABA|nr:hypothetical protein QN277_018657 [Acacia crassicarpa]